MNSWTDKDSGMRRWSILWDPDTALTLETALDAHVEALFHDTHPDGCPIDWGLDVDLPDAFLDTLRPKADVYAVKVRNGVIIEAPGELNLGRSTRLANHAQRRALSGLYATCAIPGCHVRYGHTKLHHIIWWQHGGKTDLENLLPLCELHHQKTHHNGWTITLGPHRQLTITLPDGQIMTTGPPKRNAA